MLPSDQPLRLPSRTARTQAQRKMLWNDARTIDAADFYTIGYAGRSVADIIELLQSADVCTLIDIRYNPISMYKPELSKTNLQQSVRDAGLHYLHMPQWGVPRDIRAQAIETGNRQVIWKWYDANVVDRVLKRNLHRFLNMVEHPAALMCVETDPSECHRHRLFMALEERGLRGFDL